MAGTSELIDFRRAFVWLLCGMLLPSVALVAFGVVAVVNERVAVERRLETEYGAKLRVLNADLQVRLRAGATAAAAQALAAAGPASADGRIPHVAALDPLVLGLTPVRPSPSDPVFADAVRKAETLPVGGHLLAVSDAAGDRRLVALVHVPRAGSLQRQAGTEVMAAQLDLVALAAEVPRLAAAHFPREHTVFRMMPPAEHTAPLATLRRLLNEVAPPPGRATVVARLPLDAPLDGFTLAAEVSGDDPAATLAFRNRSWYIALLALLYTGIGVGFGLTIREMRRAYKLSRLKTDFVANISHELRTPLTSVRLFAETLKAGRATDPAEVRECLDLLSKETERLSGLVEKLLDWSRLESGRKLLRRERTQVPALLEHVADVFRAQQLGASYQTHLEPDLPSVSVDRDAMAQVVLNLLHNAVKFTGDDKRIVLRARRQGPGVAIEVEDNGKGVREKDRKRIFERFYRADDLLSRHTEGTGLGLAIAKRLVEAHGGHIELETHEGKGSVFRVLLPVTA